MANIKVKNADGTTIYLEAAGAGSDVDPNRPVHTEASGAAIKTATEAVAAALKAEDSVHASADPGLLALAVRKDTAAAVAADGDYIPLIVDASGRLWIHSAHLATLAGAVYAEDVAHQSADPGVQVFAVRKDTAVALGADGDYQPLEVDASGRLHIAPAPANAGVDIGNTKDAGPSWTTAVGVSGARVTSADATATVAVTDAPTAGQKLVITDVLISVDTAMRVDLLTETTGTIHASFYLPANGSVQFTPRGKLKLPTADKKLLVDASVAGNISVTAFYFSEA